MRRNITLFGLLAVIATAPIASADPVTFAAFTQTSATKAFTWNNNRQAPAAAGCAAGALCSTLTGSTTVNFDFFEEVIPGGLATELEDNQLATLTVSATTTAAASGLGGAFVLQPGISGTISFTRNTPLNGLSNLLTVTFQNADISARINDSTATMNGSAPPDMQVIFSSDFLDFSETTARGFSLSLASLTPSYNLFPTWNGTGGFPGDARQLRDFVATLSGQFSSDPPPIGEIPEPTSMALMGLGLLAIAGTSRRFARK